MSKVFAVLGAGMQGTAVAYDLAKFANPGHIYMADVSHAQAEKSAWRVNDLIGSAVCEPIQMNALDPSHLGPFLDQVDVLASCVPYHMHPRISKVALAHGTSMVDLGGNTEISMQTLALDEQARAAGLTFVPDCGLAPGLVNNLAVSLIEQLDHTESVKLYCGVLPQNPKPPFNYKLTFNIEGLVAEYDHKAVVIRNHEIELVDTLAELEEVQWDGLGKMEAFTTSGGTSTAPYTFKEKVRNYEYKTLRFPGHCALMRVYKDFGFWSEEPVELHGARIKPVEVFYKVFGPKLAQFEDRDQCLVRAVAEGTKEGKPTRLQIDIHDHEDPVTGFTSMERLTGFSCAIYAAAIADGKMAPGALRYETAMTGAAFVEAIQKRGIKLSFS